MSFNKSKAMRNAERYLTQGKINAAINEYKQVVENDPDDINSRNMLGDLYTKANDTQAAVNCFQEVADHYNSQGFAKKAIAIYNKIYRIDPTSIEVASKLAELYKVRGSNAEARKLFREIANRYEEKGHKIEALAIWEKIALIAPSDTEIYLKIAEAYWQSDRREEAAKAYIEAGHRLYDKETYEAAVTAYSRALEVNKKEDDALKGFVRSQMALGFPEEGATALEEILEENPYHQEINYLLMDCYFEMERLDKAEAIIIKLVEREPANYSKLLELVKLYLESDDLDSSVRILSMTSEHLLVGGESEDLYELINEVLARNPEHISALRLLARYYGWQRDENELKNTLERLADSAYLNGAIEDERYALSQFVLLVPHDLNRSKRLKEINAEYGFEEGSEENLLGQNSEEVPTFESFAKLNNHDDTTAENGFEFKEQNTEIENEHNFEDSSFDDVQKGDFENQQKDIDKLTSGSIHQTNPNSIDEGQTESIHQTNPADSETESSKSVDESQDLSPSDEVRVDEEIESIKFYIEQGYTGLADKSLTELENEFGNRPEVVELRALVPNTNESQTEASDESLESTTEESVSSVEADIADANQSVAIDNNDVEVVEVTEIVEEVEFANQSDQNLEEVESVVDENLQQQEEVEESSADKEQSETENTKPNSFENFTEDLGLDENSEDSETDDYEEHYHHAVVYQEMGMLEDAIREFQDAVSKIDANDGTRRFLNCCTLIGHCFMQKEMPNLALTWFEKSLTTSDLNEKEKLGVYYETANAYEANNELDKALDQFELIYSLDVDYRDICDRIEKIKENSPALV